MMTHSSQHTEARLSRLIVSKVLDVLFWLMIAYFIIQGFVALIVTTADVARKDCIENVAVCAASVKASTERKDVR